MCYILVPVHREAVLYSSLYSAMCRVCIFHHNGKIIIILTKFLSLVALNIVKMTTYSATTNPPVTKNVLFSDTMHNASSLPLCFSCNCIFSVLRNPPIFCNLSGWPSRSEHLCHLSMGSAGLPKGLLSADIADTECLYLIWRQVSLWW